MISLAHSSTSARAASDKGTFQNRAVTEILRRARLTASAPARTWNSSGAGSCWWFMRRSLFSASGWRLTPDGGCRCQPPVLVALCCRTSTPDNVRRQEPIKRSTRSTSRRRGVTADAELHHQVGEGAYGDAGVNR